MTPVRAIRLPRAWRALDEHLARYPGQIAAMLFELVQGEGGIRTAPREFFVALMKRCQSAGIAVWVDEVQTYARTGELFAHKTLGLEEYVDVVTAGKALQGSAVLFRRAYNPRPGLVSGTYAGATVGMTVGARMIERLERDGYLGPDGRIVQLGRRVKHHLAALARALPGAVGGIDGFGAMWAFMPFDGSAAKVDAVIRAALEEGLLAVQRRGEARRSSASCSPSTPATRSSRSASRSSSKALRRVARGPRRADPPPRRRRGPRRPARARLAARLREPAARPRLPRRAHRALGALLRGRAR